MITDATEGDRLAGSPHPRERFDLVGHANAERELLAAWEANRLPHAILLGGPQGIGKATLAYRLARFVLAGGRKEAIDLSIPEDHPISRQVAVLSHPDLLVLRRVKEEDKKTMSQVIRVEDTRRITSFFGSTSAYGGWRVCVVDSVEEMRKESANAILKMLEEPPARSLFLLVSHTPGRLLPTIRSRCRELRLHPLGSDAMAQVLEGLGVSHDAARLSALSGGSVGEALRLAGQDGLELYQRIIGLFADYPRMDRRAAAALAELAAGRAGADGDPFDLVMTLLDRFLTRAARTGLMGAPLPEAAEAEAEVLTRLSPGPEAARLWADAQASLSARARAGRAVNLDPSALVLDMLIGLANQPAL